MKNKRFYFEILPKTLTPPQKEPAVLVSELGLPTRPERTHRATQAQGAVLAPAVIPGTGTAARTPVLGQRLPCLGHQPPMR